MKQKTIISALTLLSSLVGYFYAKHSQKDPVPIVMIAGFFGAMAGETYFEWFNSEDDGEDGDPPLQFN